MNSKQYEELCRYFLANKLGVDLNSIQSVEIENPRRPGLPEYKHQIDLFWETGDEVSLYLNIANAKWRSSDKVDQPEVLLLHQVKQSVGAHQAVMITNSGFTNGAKAVAQHEGIALHIVKPNFNTAALPIKDVKPIQDKLQEIAQNTNEPIYSHHVEYRAFDLEDIEKKPMSPQNSRPVLPSRNYSTKVVQTTRVTRDISRQGNINKG